MRRVQSLMVPIKYSNCILSVVANEESPNYHHRWLRGLQGSTVTKALLITMVTIVQHKSRVLNTSFGDISFTWCCSTHTWSKPTHSLWRNTPGAHPWCIFGVFLWLPRSQELHPIHLSGAIIYFWLICPFLRTTPDSLLRCTITVIEFLASITNYTGYISAVCCRRYRKQDSDLQFYKQY